MIRNSIQIDVMSSKRVLLIVILECVMAVVAMALVWTFVGHPSSRSEAVAELTLAATALGFMVASTALVWAVASAREVIAPPRLELGPQAEGAEITYNLPQVGSGQLLQNYGVSIPILLRNVGAGHCQITGVGASAVVISVRGRGWNTDSNAFSVSPSSMPRLLFGDIDLDWEPEGEDQWGLDTPFTLLPGEAMTLPGFMVQPNDLTAATDLLWFSRVAFRLTLGVHTQRGSVRLMTDIPIRGIRPPRNPVPARR